MELIDRIIEEMETEGQEYIDTCDDETTAATTKQVVGSLVSIVEKHNDPTKMLADDFIAAVDNNLDFLLSEHTRQQIISPPIDVESQMQSSFYSGCLNFCKKFISESFTNLTTFLENKAKQNNLSS